MKTIILALSIIFLSYSYLGEGDIFGEWVMYKIIQNGSDVTNEHDPHKERYLIIKQDGNFESGGRPFGKNTGKFTYNESKAELYLDSDSGPEDDSYWKVQFKKDTMYWHGFGSEWAEDFQIIQTRKYSEK